MGLKVKILRDSFTIIAPRADELANLFFDTLFKQNPDVIPLFADTDMGIQKNMFVQTLTLVVKKLDDEESLTQVLTELGARHIAYGVTNDHYPIVGKALLTSLEKYAGDTWTDEVSEAWSEAYSVIVKCMKTGAAQVVPLVELV